MRLIVYNPKGGAAIKQPRLHAALRVLRALPGPSMLVATEARDMIGPIRRALAATPGVTQVVACGGDGTVAACAAALAGRDIPIAVIPTGTTNVLTFELGLPNHPVRAAHVLAGPTRPVSFRTWSVNGHLMLLQLGVGFDGQLMWRTSRRVKRVAGFLGVVISALHLGPFYDYPLMTVEGELENGEPLRADVTSVMVANTKRWAGPQLTVPNADPADDLADVLLLNYRNFFELARFWIAILFPGAPHLRLPYVRHARMRRLKIEARSRPVEAHLDGEPDLTTPLTIEPLGRVTLLGL
ncbi:MAG: diacylglycerol kinase family protein [Gemmatimonadota bacterium]